MYIENIPKLLNLLSPNMHKSVVYKSIGYYLYRDVPRDDNGDVTSHWTNSKGYTRIRKSTFQNFFFLSLFAVHMCAH